MLAGAAWSLGTIAFTQVIPPISGLEAARELRKRSPFELPSNPPLRNAETREVPPEKADDRELEVIRAETFTRDGRTVQLRGGAEILYRGYRCFADEIDGDLDTEIFVMRGNVKVVGRDAVIYGEKVTFDFPKESFRSERGSGQLKPQFLKSPIRDDLFVKSRVSEGTERDTHHESGQLTTCNLGDGAHFEIEAADTVVRTNTRIIFRKVRLRFFDRTVLTLPFLSLPLDDAKSRYTPDVGQSRDEGYYIKNRFGVPSRPDDSLVSRVDYMSRLGNGLGGDYTYQRKGFDGKASVYGIVGSVGTLNFSNQHRQKWGRSEFAIQNDYQKDNYLTAPGTTLLNSNLQLTIPQRTGQSTVTFARQQSDVQQASSVNETLTLSDNRTFGRLRTSGNFSYLNSRNSYPGATEFSNEQLDVRFQASQELPAFGATLEYQRVVPIGDSPSVFGNADKTPVLTLTSDGNRILGKKLGAIYPFRTSASIGEFGGLRGERITRNIFDISMAKNDAAAKRFRVDYTGQFRQSAYSDDTAQYVVGGGLTASYRLGGDTSANIRYNYLRPEGYSPLQLDRTGRSHIATADVSVRPLRSLLVGAQTGYDFFRIKTSDVGWQQVGLRSEYTPTSWFQARAVSSYDTINQLWSGVRLDFSYRPGATLVTLGARYDGFQRRWSDANLFVNNLKWGRTRLSAVLTYNGFTKTIDAAQYSAIYDLHCWEAVISVTEFRTGFRPGREVQFFVRLKAFPTDSLFGIGRRGQSVGNGVGYGF
ncbi:MAG: hypothetical protein SFX74_03765 [Fimbriimonadaceae bacterium]|nr:hypothetical protein [Fimbriimonadaceae bacterium]